MPTADGSGVPGPDPVVLDVSHLTKTFPGTRALDDVSVTIARGEVHAVVGGNGSGKSTLAKVIAGLHRADAGTITVGGAAVAADSVDPAWARAAGLRFVHQDLALFPELTVAENLALGARFPTRPPGRIDWPALQAWTGALLHRFAIDAEPRTPLGELSPVDRVLVAIARALHDEPGGHVLVLDEPTAALPADRAAVVWSTVRDAAAGGDAVLFVSHRLDEVVAHADAATVLSDGRCRGRVPRSELSETRLAELIAGRGRGDRTRPARASGPRRDAPVVLALRDVRGGPLRGVSFELRAGAIVGLTGSVGAGHSEVLQAIFGARAVRGGAVVLDGEPVRFGHIGDAMRAGIAYVPGDRTDGVFADLTLSENLAAASLPSYWRRFRMEGAAELRDAAADQARYSIRAASPLQVMATVSGGNQQKALVARWLRREPRLLLLDAPTRGVDVGARADVYEFVIRAADRGSAVLVASDDVVELATLCDHVLVFERGVVAHVLDGPDVRPERIAERAFGATVG